jgi:hypothetical protein
MNKIYIKIDENIDYDLEKSDLENKIDYFTAITKFIETFNEIKEIISEIKNLLTQKNIRIKNDVYVNIIENIRNLQNTIILYTELINTETNKRYEIKFEELLMREELERNLIYYYESQIKTFYQK